MHIKGQLNEIKRRMNEKKKHYKKRVMVEMNMQKEENKWLSIFRAKTKAHVCKGVTEMGHNKNHE